jgi:Holliday junction DNA helicase RuvA
MIKFSTKNPSKYKKGLFMIDYISGKIQKIYEKSAVILVNGIGFSCHVPQVNKLKKDAKVELFTYLHWNQEKGPSLYGFHTEIERTTFLMIIDCPKIGPGIALTILSQIPAMQFLEIIISQNDKALSAINGIGAKKAEQLITSLKHKVAKLIEKGGVPTESMQQDFVQWQNINDVLASLGYSRQEIGGAIKYLTETNKGQNYSLDQLIRSALGYLSKTTTRFPSS